MGRPDKPGDDDQKGVLRVYFGAWSTIGGTQPGSSDLAGCEPVTMPMKLGQSS